MAAPNFHDQIPDYFAGGLSLVERQAFEKALDEDVSLKEAAAIWTTLDEVLAPAPEDKLLENIALLRAASVEGPPSKPWSWKWGIPVVLLIGALSWYFWPEHETTAPAIEAVPTTQDSNSLQVPVDTLGVAPKDTLPVETFAPPTTPDPPFRRPVLPPPEEVEEIPQAPVFAANYDPNPLIEAEMTDELRGESIDLEVTSPAPDAFMTSNSRSTNLTFAGTVMTDLAEDEFTLRLLLLSNLVEDYQQSNFLRAIPIVLTSEADAYTFTLNLETEIEPGLYYYFIEWEEEETYLAIGRFSVE